MQGFEPPDGVVLDDDEVDDVDFGEMNLQMIEDERCVKDLTEILTWNEDKFLKAK